MINRFYGLALGLLVLGWLVPNHYYPWPTFYNELPPVLGMLLFVVSIQRLARFRNLPFSALALIFLATLPVAQFFLGQFPYRGDALMACFFICGVAFSIYGGYAGAQVLGGDMAKGLAFAIVVGSLASLWIAARQWLGFDPLSIWTVEMRPGDRPYGNLAQPNNLSTLLFMGLLSVGYLYEKNRLSKGGALLIALLFVFGIAMVQSRTAFVELAVFLALCWWRSHSGGMRFNRGFLYLTIFFTICWILVPWLENALLLTETVNHRSFSPGARWTIWQQILDAISREPWVGYGWVQTSVAQVLVANAHDAGELTDYSHNLALDFLVWNGVPIGTLLIAMLLYWLIDRVRKIHTEEAWFGMFLICALLSHSLLEYPHAYAYFLIPAGLMAGMIENETIPQAISFPRISLAIATLIFGTMIAFVMKDYVLIEENYRRMRFEAVGIEPSRDRTDVPDVMVLDQWQDFLRFARSRATTNMSPAEIAWMGRVAHRFAFPPVLFRYCLALALNGRVKEAREELIRLRQLHSPERYREAVEAIREMAIRYPQLNELLDV